MHDIIMYFIGYWHAKLKNCPVLEGVLVLQ